MNNKALLKMGAASIRGGPAKTAYEEGEGVVPYGRAITKG